MGYSDPDPAPRMMQPSEAADSSRDAGFLPVQWQERYSDPRSRASDDVANGGDDFDSRYARYRAKYHRDSPTLAAQPMPEFDGHFVGQQPSDDPMDPSMIESRDGGQRYAEGRYIEGQLAEGPLTEGRCGAAPCAADEGCQECEQGFCARFRSRMKNCWLFSPAMWENFNEFSGVQAFKSPVDRGVNGNFGFQKGVNWARPLWDEMGIGYQLGGLIALSDFDGGAGIVNHGRDQYFVTTGLFRRANCNQGWQGGAVVDYLHDQFYVRMNMLQMRFEVSYLFKQHEIGVWSAVHANSDTRPAPASFNQATVTWQANDQYNLFYRCRFAGGGVGRMWVGLTNFADILFGCDATAPLSERWAIQGSYNYLAPSLNPLIPNAIKETWGISLTLVWYPGYKVPNACFNPYRPLFNVADNGWFMLREKD